MMKNAIATGLGLTCGIALATSDDSSLIYGLSAFMIGTGIAILTKELLKS